VRITTKAGTHLPVVSPDGTTIATLHSDDVTPPELYLGDASGGGPERRVTQSPPPEYASYPWGTPRYVHFQSPGHPLTLHARILEPPALDRSAKHAVLFGPVYSNSARNRWNGLYGLLQQYLVSRGFIVVQVDIRGSSGYGRDFREKFLMDWGGGDLDDLEAGVNYMKTLPYVDSARFGIWGTSYGGTLTVFMLFKKPGLFTAGVAAAPAVDPFFFGPDDVAIARTPQTNPEAFERGNAGKYAANLRDHLLIIHGMQDDVVPFKTSVALAEHLMRLGKDFDFAFAPAATHAWTQREHYARYLFGKLVAHFERYLGADSTSTAGQQR
jgi:dipeptidyl-peptidase-4